MKRRTIKDLEATFLYKDTPLFRFKLDSNGSLTEYEKLSDKFVSFPIEFRQGEINEWAFQEFLADRVVPETRQGLEAVLSANEIYSYDTKLILQATHGLCTDDCYWMKFPGINDTLNYDNIKLRNRGED